MVNTQKDKEEREYQNKLRRIIVFPGSVAEYEQMMRYKVEIIDTKREDKGVIYIKYTEGEVDDVRITDILLGDREIGPFLIKEGIEAIVNATANTGVHDCSNYGLPVRRKREK